jgi:hypothetical protein
MTANDGHCLLRHGQARTAATDPTTKALYLISGTLARKETGNRGLVGDKPQGPSSLTELPATVPYDLMTLLR